MSKVNPTRSLYEQLQFAYSFFNERLFNGELPNCLITLQREKKTAGFFSPERWSSFKGGIAHEISLNPSYFLSRALIEIFQTIVHEQCHLWQFEYGRIGRKGYHNSEWASKMMSVGLVPSHNGLPGGKSTGQKMSDYRQKNGPFDIACTELMETGFLIEWIQKEPIRNLDLEKISRSENINFENIQEILETPLVSLLPTIELTSKPRKNKVKYHCPNCGINIWGKPRLNIKCIDCNLVLVYCLLENEIFT